MSFKENLLEKLSLDRMRQRVLSSLGPIGSSRKIDKKAMRGLLVAAGFRSFEIRGLELYLPDGTTDDEHQAILVLDNDLPVYKSTVDDVAMRKEPTLKEMISIRNAMRILNDSDVVTSRKEASVKGVYEEAVSRLDLSFTEADIKQLEYEGRAAVEWKDADSVVESVALFGELLTFVPEPAAFAIEHCLIRGRLAEGSGKESFGPALVFHAGDGSLRWIEEHIVLTDREGISRFKDKASGKREPDLAGPEVIKHLAAEVVRGMPSP
ncbi:hypothetical protein [Desulfoluna spongiiphila]|uniref:Uncharacterized protein n=1 Tax=Desulfoluna spongiiphila TaxID=419481 RepID=A0A1G5I4H6_9BACT|nr:hypothetical protein [Desulfoluna spongiiphila]SCY70953.1 hypothetical protein SAMN05216233_117111 [Desulfoluna spongiiphila]